MISRKADIVTKENMASYSKYVAQNRSVPALVDGLKPSQRRCITSADDLHLRSSGRFMKASKIEGTVIGDYHPHGGVSLAGLIQPFNIRYPLMEGQGNWGCPDDPGSVAASRYVEAKLTRFCEDFYLKDREYCETAPNYDGRLQEVVRYCPPIPGVLLTSAEGIAIGLTTKIPPYEIGEVCESLLQYIDGNRKYLDLTPDTCEESIILSSLSEIREMNSTGVGSIRYRAKTHYERSKDGYYSLVIDAFPPDYRRKRLENQEILDLVESGNLTLSNESSTGIRYVFKSKSMDVLESLKPYLESTVSYKYLIEDDGIVHQYALSELYDVFIKHRVEFILRKYNYLSERTKSELDYYVALLALKSNPTIVRKIVDMSESEVLPYLMEHISTTEKIIKRILSSSIRTLLRDNTSEIRSKISEMEESMREYASIISSPMTQIIKEIKECKSKYGGPRRAIIEDPVEVVSDVYYIEESLVEIKKDESEYMVVRKDDKYVFIKGETGFVVCSMDTFLNRVPDTVLKEPPEYIIGLSDLSEVHIKEPDREYDLEDWCIRVRKSLIILPDGSKIYHKGILL